MNIVTQVTWEECKETCMDECSEQHFKESVTDIVEHSVNVTVVDLWIHTRTKALVIAL